MSDVHISFAFHSLQWRRYVKHWAVTYESAARRRNLFLFKRTEKPAQQFRGQHFTDETCDNLKHQSIGRPAAGCKTANRLWIEQINTNGGLLKWFKWSATDLSKIEQIEIKLTTN